MTIEYMTRIVVSELIFNCFFQAKFFTFYLGIESILVSTTASINEYFTAVRTGIVKVSGKICKTSESPVPI